MLIALSPLLRGFVECVYRRNVEDATTLLDQLIAKRLLLDALGFRFAYQTLLFAAVAASRWASEMCWARMNKW